MAFTVMADRRLLLGLRHMAVDNDPTGRRAGWSLELDPRGWDVVHGDGQRRMGVDAFSRRLERDRHGRG